VRDCDEGTLVWLDGDLEVLNAVLLNKGFVTFRIRAGDKCAENIVRTWHLSIYSAAAGLNTYSIVFNPNVFR